MKLFKKVKYPNGRRHIYLFGIKIFSYQKQTTKTIITNNIIENKEYIKYCSSETLHKLLCDTFYKNNGIYPNEQLTTLNHKIQHMMMFDVTPLRTMVADKYTVRNYVKNKIGSDYLIPLLQHWDSINDVSFEKLPNKFVLKYSEGSAKVLMVPNKEKLDLNYVKNKIRYWIYDEYWTHFMEMQYYNSVKKIIVEEMIDTKIEYKLWCFNGIVKFIKIEIMDGFSENGKTEHQYGKYFYPDWTPADFKTIGDEPPYEIKRSQKLKLLIKLAEKLASEFKFVRVDFFETNSGELKFGEMTLSPAAGNVHFIPESKNTEFGSWL